MTIDADLALTALDEAIGWKLRPALNPDRLFDELACKLRRYPAFKHMTLVEIDLMLADLRREFAHNMHDAEWQLYDAFKTVLGVHEDAGV